jgi:rfaE bifunctional protein kinase chain/domain
VKPSVISSNDLVRHWQNLRIVVVGDVMVDRYIWGEVHRISPEAPVPVVNVQRIEQRLGGAANVALNLKALGVTPVVIGLVGEDIDAQTLIQLFENQNLATSGLIHSPHRVTTVKTRVLGNHQQLLRLDAEGLKHSPSPEELAQEQALLLNRISEAVAQSNGILFQDYDKGTLTTGLIKKVVQTARHLGIPSLADPKFEHFFDFADVTIFKPNLKELDQGLKQNNIDKYDEASLTAASAELLHRMNYQHLLLTLSEAGVWWYDPALGNGHQFEAHRRQIVDVSGAGDTVAAVALAAYCAGLHMQQVVQLANLAGGLVCEWPGVVPITLDNLIREAVKLGILD